MLSGFWCSFTFQEVQAEIKFVDISLFELLIDWSLLWRKFPRKRRLNSIEFTLDCMLTVSLFVKCGGYESVAFLRCEKRV